MASPLELNPASSDALSTTLPASSSAPSSLAPPPSRSRDRHSNAVSFDKSVLNMLKLDTHDLDIQDHALIVIDKEKRKQSRRTCTFGCNSPAPYRQSIPLYNVLWAEVSGDSQRLLIDHAESASKTRLQAAQLSIPLVAGPDRPTAADAAAWAELLLTRAYGPAPMRRRALVLVNPRAGPGGATKKWETQVRPIFTAARMDMTVVTTKYGGQAAEMCAKLELEGPQAYDIIVPCSGDGLAHEVFNGLGQRPDAARALQRIAVAHVPCGSGNAMACNLYGTHRASLAALAIVKGVVAPLDLVSITQTDGRRILSFLSQAVGIVAESDLATEHLRWMGEARFTFGFLQRFMAQKTYPCDLALQVAIDDKEEVRAHYSSRRHEERAQRELRRLERAKLGDASSSSATSGSASALASASASASGNASDDERLAPPSSGADESSSEAATGEGLPPLRFGTVSDRLPDGWELVPQEKIGNFYCGNMAYMAPDANFFSAALMNDGLMDLITIDGDIPLHKSLAMVSSVENGRMFDNPLVHYRKIAGYRLVPRQTDGYISIDGERVPFGPFQAEVHQGLGRVIARQTVGYAAPGPANWDKVTAAECIRA